MTTEKKVGMGIAGQPTGGAVNVADVFSTYLYTGNDGVLAINNGIDLAGEGGMVWTKSRTSTQGNILIDSERGDSKYLTVNATSGEDSLASFAFSSTGYTIPAGYNGWNAALDYASWTFRKAPKFFDIVTYTGNGGTTTPQTIAHGLDSAVGMMLIKSTSSASWNWVVYHTALGSSQKLRLNLTDAAVAENGSLGGLAPTTTDFTVAYNATNELNTTYVAYLFADNTAEDADDQMIKCGSYTGSGAGGLEVSVGWEPQYVMIKPATAAGNWNVLDTMRGITDSSYNIIRGNLTVAELVSTTTSVVSVSPAGFAVNVDGSDWNTSGQTYIYMAIRAPMMVEPSAGTEVFDVIAYTGVGEGTTQQVGTSVTTDLTIASFRANVENSYVIDRMRGHKLRLFPQGTNTEQSRGDFNAFPQLGVSIQSEFNKGSTTYVNYQWKRAKGFFDVVAYSGTGVAGREVIHSLSVIPEMMIVKSRTAGNQQWAVYHASLGATKALRLDHTNAAFTVSTRWNNTAPTTSNFTVGTSGAVNDATQNYISYLFASVAGVSKVGSFSHTYQTDTNVDCGFSNGARFILIKRTDSTGDWRVYDTARGIVAGADPETYLNKNTAEYTGGDYIDPYSSGFTVVGDNFNSGTYIYYAIA